MSHPDAEQPPAPPILGEGVAPMPEVVDPKVYEPAHDLIYTRSVRAAIIQGIQGNGIPKDLKMLQMLLSTLKDTDSAALGQMRIKSEEKGQSLQAEHQSLVREMLTHLNGAKPPMKAASNEETPLPELPDTIEPVRDFVPGELEQGTINRTFEEFSRQVGGVELSDTDAKD